MARKYCADTISLNVLDLSNAETLCKNYGLKIPENFMIRAIQPDDKVELDRQGERFWVVVDEVIVTGTHYEFIGQVETNVNFSHPFQQGSCILFSGENIISIYGRDWKNKIKL